MDLYLLDFDFNPWIILEDYESLIWTETFQSYGNFNLVIKQSGLLSGTTLLLPKYLGLSTSSRIMVVETMDSQAQSDGDNKLTFTGRSIESFLLLRSSKSHANREPERVTGSPGVIASHYVNYYCVDPATASPLDRIPELEIDWAPPGPASAVTLDRGPIYDSVKTVCELYGLDFRIKRSTTPGKKLTFYLVDPLDTSNPASPLFREFSLDANNLQNISSTESITNYKNHARVLGYKTGKDVYIRNTSPTVSGFDRRTLVVEATDVGDDTTTVAADQEILAQIGLKALQDNNNKYVRIIDGDVIGNWNDTYFQLGQLVRVKDSFGRRTRARVTEVIYSSGPNGDSIYPSFQGEDPD